MHISGLWSWVLHLYLLSRKQVPITGEANVTGGKGGGRGEVVCWVGFCTLPSRAQKHISPIWRGRGWDRVLYLGLVSPPCPPRKTSRSCCILAATFFFGQVLTTNLLHCLHFRKQYARRPTYSGFQSLITIQLCTRAVRFDKSIQYHCAGHSYSKQEPGSQTLYPGSG